MLSRIEHLSHGIRRTIENMVFSDAVRQLAATGYELLFSKDGKTLLSVKDQTGNVLYCPGDGEIGQLSDGLTVADINAMRTSGAKVKRQSA
jgi:hypothetical protein